MLEPEAQPRRSSLTARAFTARRAPSACERRNHARLDNCVTSAVALSRRNLTAIAGVVVILLLILFSLPIAVEPRIKQRLMNALGERFDSEVQVESLTVSLLPRPRLSGRGLVLRHKHRTDVPPLVLIASFSGEAGLVGLLSDRSRSATSGWRAWRSTSHPAV